MAPAVLLLGLRLYFSSVLPFAAEDAYITFRYAENLASGLGPVYNPGEAVMGFSSPLWVAWLGLGSALTGQVLLWARLSSIALDLGTLLLGVHVLEREHSRLSGWGFAAFFALWPLFGAYAVLGMETSLFLFLLVLAAHSVARAPAWRAGGLLGLLALTRPEGLAAAVVVALGANWRARAWGAGVVAAAAIGLTLYYGTPLPESVVAKAVTYGTPGPGAAQHWFAGLLPVFLGGWPEIAEVQHLFPLSLVTAPAAVVGVGVLWRTPGAARLVAAGGLLVLAGYVVFGVPFFAWYLVVPAAAWMWTAAVGLPKISRHPLLWMSLAAYLGSDVFVLGRTYVERGKAEAAIFRPVAERLARLSGGRGSVLLEPIGTIGYVSRLRVLDEVGLVSPEIRRRRQAGAGWYAETIAAERPEYLVVRPEWLARNRSFAGVGAPFRSSQERDAVLSEYRPIPGGPPGGLEVWVRSDLPAAN